MAGKVAATVDEQAWFDACRQLGCVAHARQGLFRRMEEQHHLIDGGRRVGHCASIPLCRDCHQEVGIDVMCRILRCTEVDLLADTVKAVMAMVRARGLRL